VPEPTTLHSLGLKGMGCPVLSAQAVPDLFSPNFLLGALLAAGTLAGSAQTIIPQHYLRADYGWTPAFNY